MHLKRNGLIICQGHTFFGTFVAKIPNKYDKSAIFVPSFWNY
jgi:hypothetical protein